MTVSSCYYVIKIIRIDLWILFCWIGDFHSLIIFLAFSYEWKIKKYINFSRTLYWVLQPIRNLTFLTTGLMISRKPKTVIEFFKILARYSSDTKLTYHLYLYLHNLIVTSKRSNKLKCYFSHPCFMDQYFTWKKD